MTIGIGIIGAGIMGADQARTLATHVGGTKLIAVSDPDEARASNVARANEAARHYTDGFALIEDAAVEAVIVASPDDTHARMVLACLRAGKPVLCEKPLAPTVAECLELIAAEQRSGRHMIQVGFMRRFDPAYAAMHETLSSGRLGRPLLMHCAHRNAKAPAFFTPEMSIANAAVHEFDIVRWLMGLEAVAVTAIRSARKGEGTLRDPILLLLELENGVLVDIEIFMNAAYGYDIRAELVCENGTVELGRPAPNLVRHAGEEARTFPSDWRGRFNDAYRLQLQAWIGSLRGKPQNGAGALDGYIATLIAQAALRSLASGAREEIAPDASIAASAA
ncbi:MAG: inositol 2-dehydrogenase [Mesorhizobium sp.]|uniref:Gfo/Idh/MocA family oxidoreductase n=1 Tax=Mesorhizobium sp. TaxID=1871066 RepID=UPI001214CAD3|nr:Gfo/Idh/MocA family oxidoreductase [Mesorhizobium sp.]TIP27760.1 MAG: inositol 2-dehydrogenase [Mesorhizobium sp.]